MVKDYYPEQINKNTFTLGEDIDNKRQKHYSQSKQLKRA